MQTGRRPRASPYEDGGGLDTGILEGSARHLYPQGDATRAKVATTRAKVATMHMRFCEQYSK